MSAETQHGAPVPFEQLQAAATVIFALPAQTHIPVAPWQYEALLRLPRK